MHACTHSMTHCQRDQQEQICCLVATKGGKRGGEREHRKALTRKRANSRLNPSITYQAHKTHLTPQNAEQIVAQYDVVLDCTDRPASRYLVSDICVLLGKPLVSAAAFQTHGQLIVLNSPPGKGPCYRCIVPKPPPPDSVVGCGEGGIVGPVVGVMGVLQALEAIKLIANVGPSQQGSDDDDGDASHRCPTMLVFSALKSAPFTSARMRGRKPGCFGCSGELTLSQLASSMDYVQFCGVQKPVQQLGTEERVAPEAFRDMADSGTEHVLLDVRGEEHFSLASIPGSFNVPVGRITSHRGGQGTLPDGVSAALQQRPQSPRRPLFVVCREGNDSQLAVAKLKELGLSARDISGGLRAWKNTVDASFPFL